MPRNDDAPNTGWQTAVEVSSVPRILTPFSGIGDTSAKIYERDFIQNGDYWTPLALDTADGVFTSAFLIEETQPQQFGNGLVKWTRRFGTVPSTFSHYSAEQFTFFGYYDSYETNTSYRDPYPRATVTEITNTFIKSTDPETDFPFASGDQKLLSQNNRGEFVGYVDGNTTPTISTYQGYVSANTQIVIRDPLIERCYGSGNIWRKQVYKAEAQ
jgi:hypothetical protein